MAKHGPSKKNPILEALEGFPGKSVIEESGIAGIGEPFIHEHLMDDARACVEVIKTSMPKRVYSKLDTFNLASFAMALAMDKKAANEIGNPNFEWIIENGNGSKIPSPWIKILNAQASLIVSVGDRLGLDPASRASLKVPKEQKRSKFDGLIGQTELSNSSKPLSFRPALVKEPRSA
jgi:phage terminase small subunit